MNQNRPHLSIFLLIAALLISGSAFAAPPNDNKSNATTLSQTNNWCSSLAIYTNSTATNDGSSGSCGSPYGNVWFKFQASTTYAKIDVKVGGTEGTLRYPQISLWNSSNSEVTCVSQLGSTTDVSIESSGLTIGQWYYISVYSGMSSGSYQGTFSLCVTDVGSNDVKANALTLNQKTNWCSALAAYTNVGATNDGNAGNCGQPNSNVWFKFQATTSYIKLEAKTGTSEGTIQYPHISLWDNNDTEVSCSTDYGYNTDALLEGTNLTIGQWYFVSIYSHQSGTSSQGTFTLCVTDQKLPDEKVDAIELTQKSNWCSELAGYTNLGATNDGVSGNCGSMYNNVWYKFQASTAYVKIDVKTGGAEGTMQRPKISLWNNSNVEVSCADNNYVDDVSLEKLDLVVGQWYYVSIYSSDNSSYYQGTFSLCVNDQKFPDNKADAIELTQRNNWCSELAKYTNVSATNDGSSGTCGSPNSNVWYKFQATTSYVKIDVKTGSGEGTMYRPEISLWNSSNVEVGCADNSYVEDVSLEKLDLVVGQWYYVSIYSSESSSYYQGTFSLCLNDQAPFDLKQGAIELTQKANWCSALQAYTNVNATNDGSSSTCGAPNNNVWFKFQAATPYFKFTVKTDLDEGTIRYPEIAVWNSTNTQVICSNSGGSLNDVNFEKTDLTVGQWYYISVYNIYSGTSDQGTFSICATDQKFPDNKIDAIELTQRNNWCSALKAYTNIGATSDGSISTCGSPNSNVWFKFQATTPFIKLDIKTGADEGTIQYPEIALWNSSNVQIVCSGYVGSLDDVGLEKDGLTIGEWYYLSVFNNYSGSSDQGTFTICANDQATFNYKSGAVELTQRTNWCSANALYTNAGSTVDGSASSCSTSQGDVWFKFQATTDYLKLNVKTGGVLGTLTYPQVVLRDNNGVALQCTQELGTTTAVLEKLNLTIGQWYYISVSNVSGQKGTFTMCINDMKLPDNKVDAVNLTSKTNWCSANAIFNNIGSTVDGTPGSCSGSSNGDVWFKFQATTGYIKIDVKGNGAFGTLAYPQLILRNSAGTPIACQQSNGSDGLASIEEGSLVIGQLYYFTVANWNSSQGTFTICANDQPTSNFKEGAIELTQKSNWCSGQAAYTNVNATPDGPTGSCGTLGGNIWFKFQATTPYIKLDVKTGGAEGTIQYPAVALWNNSNTLVTCATGTYSSDDVMLETNVTAGEWYYVSIYSAQSSAAFQGTFTLCVNDQVTFDNRLGAVELTQRNNWCSALATYSNVGATSEGLSGTCGAVDNSVWFKFQATTAYVKMQLNTGGTEGTMQYPEIALYNNSSSLLTCTNNTTWNGDVVLSKGDLTIGQWYYVAVYSNGLTTSYQGTFSLCVNENISCDTPPVVYTAPAALTCFGQSTASVVLPGSETGVTYFLNGLLPLAGTGSSISWPNIGAGTHIITAQRNACTAVTVTLSNVVVSQHPAITAYNVGGGAAYCSSGTVTLSGSATGISYQLKKTSDNSSVGSPLAGTGSSLTFSNISSSGTYTVVGTSSTGCVLPMTGNAAVVVNPLPQTYNVSGQSMCSGSTTSVNLSGSQSGVNYQLKLNGSNTGSAIAGTGSALTWPTISVAGTYTIVATNSSTSCVSAMTGNAVITIYTIPTAYTVSGSKVICASSNGAIIQLNNSDFGVDYQLQLGGVNTGSIVKGTGFPLSFAPQMAAGTYTVTAVNSAGSVAGVNCPKAMNGNAIITVNPSPTLFTVSGGGSITGTTTQFTVNLSGSQSGAFNYQLQLNGNNKGAVKAGTGSALSWTGLTETGSYTVVAINSTTTCSVQMTGSGVVVDPSKTVDFLNNLAFQYRYDERNRMVKKKVPGADWVYMVYDDRDRLVLSQDGEQRKTNQWTFTKYDALNRPVTTGFYTDAHTLDGTTNDIQTIVNTYYSSLTASQAWYETYSTTGGNVHGYDNKSFPQITDANAYLTVAYYDNYDFVNSLIANPSFTYNAGDQTGHYNYNSTGTSFPRVVGLPTGGKVKILGQPGSFLWNVSYYDDKSRVVQTVATNSKALTTIDRSSTIYNFAGQVISSKTTYGLTNSPVTARTFSYDHMGRLLQTAHTAPGGTSMILSRNEYNEIGQPVDKKLHSTDNGTTFKQSVDSRFNIRGWLTSINDSQLAVNSNNDETTDLFGMNLAYNESIGTGNTSLYSGNISAIKWSANLALPIIKERAYNYMYDTLNRIKAADYLARTAGVWANPSSAFSETGYAYDLNGNILKMQRRSGSGALMDDMKYEYGEGHFKSNMLLKITDSGSKSEGFADGSNIDNDYSYDKNGNISLDNNKTVSAITYNYLNLPQIVTKTNGDNIKYTYDATGRKLSQAVYLATAPASPNKVTHYVGEAIIEDDQTKFFNHEEGRVVMTGATPEYQYHLKDHLGNVRTTFTSKDEIETTVATLETANQTTEQNKFLKYNDARKVNSTLLDHTNGASTGYAQRLNGSVNEKYGLARSLSVMPGDKIKMEVYAKYIDPNSSNWTAALSALLNSIANGTAGAGTVIDGSGYLTNGNNHLGYTGILPTEASTGNGPRAYLNYMMFDRDFNPITDIMQSNFVRMTSAAKESGNDVAHELLSAEITVKQPGYIYIYLSNEEPVPLEVYFDDFKVTQTKSPIIQMDDYYPFGLTFNSYQRENSLLNNYKYNGKEVQDELNLGWVDYGARMYMPEVGRWGQIDPLSSKYLELSPYTYVANNPLSFIDPDGKKIIIFGERYGFLGLRRQRYEYRSGGAAPENAMQFVKDAFKALDYARGGDVNGIIDALANSEDKNVYVKQTRRSNGFYNPMSNKIKWNSKLGAELSDGGKVVGRQPAALVLFHEVGHGYRENFLPEEFYSDAGVKDEFYGYVEERKVIENYETPAAMALGHGVRTNHEAKLYPTESPISTKGLLINSPRGITPGRYNRDNHFCLYPGAAGPADGPKRQKFEIDEK